MHARQALLFVKFSVLCDRFNIMHLLLKKTTTYFHTLFNSHFNKGGLLQLKLSVVGVGVTFICGQDEFFMYCVHGITYKMLHNSDNLLIKFVID